MTVLKKIWLHAFKSYLSLGLFFYYRRIKVFNNSNIPKDQSVLILCNHQNALLDALLIAINSPRFVYFLTRASVFKKPAIQRFLKSLQMLPVYRVRDGWRSLPKNNEIFETCCQLLHNKEAVVIFPEGNHNLKRTVRPLSKGFTRIVFETLKKHPNKRLNLIPVGLNFEKGTDFKDSVSIYFGEPFLANHYLRETINESTIRLKQDVQEKISQLTTHIPSEAYENTIKKLEELNVDFLNPKDVNACIKNNFKDCQKSTKNELLWLNKLLKFLLIVCLIVPYVIWKFYAQPKIKELEFTGTFRFAIALTLVPLWLMIIGVLLTIYFSLAIGLGFVLFVLLLAFLTIKL